MKREAKSEVRQVATLKPQAPYNIKNWFFFYTFTFFFIINTYIALSMFPAFSLSIGASPFQAGLQNTVLLISAVSLRFIFGPILDKYSPKPLILFAMAAYAAANIVLVFFPVYKVLLAVRVVQGLGFAVVLPGISSLVAQMAPPGKLGSYLGTTRMFYNLGLLTGPSAALYIIEQSGYSSMFITSSISLAVSILALILVQTPTVSKVQRERVSLAAQFKKAVKIPKVPLIISGIAVFAFTYSPIISFSAIYVETSVPSANAPLFFAILGFTGMLACAWVGRLTDRLGSHVVTWPLLAFMGLGAVIFSFIPGRPVLVYASAIIFGLSIQGASLALAKWLIDISKPGIQATLLSLQENMIDLFFALSAFVFGAAAGGIGLKTAFLGAGILTLVLVVPLIKTSAKSAP